MMTGLECKKKQGLKLGIKQRSQLQKKKILAKISSLLQAVLKRLLINLKK
jgi:hypothetical protein